MDVGPGEPSWLSEKGAALSQSKRHGEAIQSLPAPPRLNNDAAHTYSGLGKTLHEGSRHADAIASFGVALCEIMDRIRDMEAGQ